MDSASAANQGGELIEMTQVRFGALTDAEKKLLQAAPTGEWAQCGPSFDEESENDPAHAENWGEDRVVRAAILRWVCVDPEAKMRVDPRGIQVHGALLFGPVDLSFVVVPFPLGLWRCRLTHPANFISAEIPALGLTGCRIEMLLADRLVTSGDVFLRHDFHALGPVRLIGAKIGGRLDCVGGKFHGLAQNDREGAGRALSADGIQVNGGVLLSGEFAAQGEVSLMGAQIGGDLVCAGGTFHNPAQAGVKGAGTALNADGIAIEGSLFLTGGFRAVGEVRLLGGAHIRGQLVCVGGVFHNPPKEDLEETGVALSADGIAVDGGIFLTNGFHAEGEVRLLGAKVGTNLECAGGMFHNSFQPSLKGSGKALSAKAIEVKGDVFLNEGFRADGEVRLPGAHIGGDLQCVDGTFYNPAQRDFEGTGKALSADGIRVSGAVLLSKGFQAYGEVRIVGAQIGGQLSCMGGIFQNPAEKDIPASGKALGGDSLHVDGDVFLGKEFRAKGEVRLSGAQVGGDLSCAGGVFDNIARDDIAGTGIALTLEGMKVNGSVNLCEEFRARGGVRLIGAQIRDDLNCTNGIFSNPIKPGLAVSGDALQADRIDVKAGVHFSGSLAEGTVNLTGARIGLHLDCVGGRFDRLNAEGISVGKIFWWRNIREPAKATLNLTNATVDAVVDDKESWPGRGKLYLDGFVWGRFPDGPMTAKERLEWLSRVEPFTPQPYRQLAKVFRDSGDDRGAIDVLMEMEDRLWRKDDRWAAGISRRVLWATVGYGYRPLRAVWSLLVLILLGWAIYGVAQIAGQVVPTEEKTLESFRGHKGLPEIYPRFFPLVYSVENSVPVLKLGQVDHWQPNPSSQVSGQAGGIWYLRLRNFITNARFLTYFRWGQIITGWLLATLFVAGLTGIVRRV